MDLDLADLIQRTVYLGAYDRETTGIFRRLLRPGDCVVDAGANVGYFTAVAARLVGPGGRVLACEPSPRVYHKLRHLVDNNHLDHVTALRLGLSDAERDALLSVPPADSGNDNATLIETEDAERVSVRLRRLDDVADEFDLPPVRLLKIDVEGHEPGVIRGASRLIEAGRVKHVVCEFNRHWLERSGSSPEALHRLMREYGFTATGWPAEGPLPDSGCYTGLYVHESARR